ncbi:MAG: acyl carrier protein [Pirellulaceae bacterium]|nr:acyl carrier protein [Pirellulaceae bacterium]
MAVTISSRTPEGHDSRCPLCGAETAIEYSLAGDASCPNCGSLLWGEEAVFARMKKIIAEQLGVDRDRITPEYSIGEDVGNDSLDVVEMVMVLEEEFDINIPDDAAEKMQTIGDLIRFIVQHRKWKPGNDEQR